MQQTLADLTGITQGDQILMCEGARLDGARQLSAYGLPWVSVWAPVAPAGTAGSEPRVLGVLLIVGACMICKAACIQVQAAGSMAQQAACMSSAGPCRCCPPVTTHTPSPPPPTRQAGEGKVPDVFLYSRAHLRADAPLPPPEALPECPLDCEPSCLLLQLASM